MLLAQSVGVGGDGPEHEERQQGRVHPVLDATQEYDFSRLQSSHPLFGYKPDFVLCSLKVAQGNMLAPTSTLWGYLSTPIFLPVLGPYHPWMSHLAEAGSRMVAR